MFEAGVLISMIEGQEERVKPSLSGVRKQIIGLLEDTEKAAGVVKKLLPGGMLELTAADGTKLIRPPQPWEVEGKDDRT